MRNVCIAFLLSLSAATYASNLSVDSLKVYAMTHWKTEPQKCLEYTYEAGKKAWAAKDTNTYAWSLNFRGIIYGFTGNFDSSFYYYDQSLSFCKKNGIEEFIFKSTMNLAINHQQLGNYEKSLNYFWEVLQIFEEKGDSLGIAHCFAGIANNYVKLDQYPKAEDYYLRSIAIYDALEMPLMTAPIYSNLGVIYRDQHRSDEALAVFLKAIPILEESQQYISLVATYVNVAGLYNRTDYTKADNYYDKAIALCIELEKNDVLVLAYTGKGELRNKNGKPNEAISWLRKALAVPLDEPNLSYEYDIYLQLTQAFEQTHQADSALYYFKKKTIVKVSLNGLEVNKSIAQLEIDYETAKKEKQLAEQKITLAEQEAQVQRRNVQLVGLGAGLITVFLLGGMVYSRQKGKQQRLQQQLELEKAESLNKVQDEKLRISRDLHDNIGSQLTFVISSLDNLNYVQDEARKTEKLNELGSFTRNTMNELRETIWAIKSESISLEQLASKVAEFVDKAKVACPHIQFSMKSTLANERSLHSNQAINLYRTMQEAINNAIKHANCQHITVHISDQQITVSDDGKGFERSAITEGNGTVNMYARIKEIGFRFDLQSVVGQGTKVIIHL